MLSPFLPPEVVLNIFLYVPAFYLKYFHDGLPTGKLKDIVAFNLYKSVYFGPPTPDESLRRISIEELRELARQDSGPRIKVLILEEIDDIGDYKDVFESFLQFVGENPLFMAEIPVVHYKGSTIFLTKYASRLTVANFVSWKGLELYASDISSTLNIVVPSNLAELKFANEANTYMAILGFPSTLRKLAVFANVDTGKICLPAHLEEFKCMSEIQIWDEFPQGLKKLSLLQHCIPPEFEFTDSLTDLSLRSCSIRHSGLTRFVLPQNLKKLTLSHNPLGSIDRVNFPDSLEDLDISGCGISSLADVTFPPLLEKLQVSDNVLTNLDNVDFPPLKFLDVSTHSTVFITSMSKIKFPTTLVTLCSSGQPVEDWSNTKLPESLQVLTIMASERAADLRFPKCLEKLRILFLKSSRAVFADLKLPKTLVLLHLQNGKCLDFDWNLPLLKKMYVKGIVGSIRIPDTVEELELFARDYEVYQNLTLPYGLESVTMRYLITRYPETLHTLKITNFDSQLEVEWPSRLRTLYLSPGDYDDVNGSNLKLPRTLEFLKSEFDPEPEWRLQRLLSARS